tara:strand:+ start:191 stop:760 length:570 start_codon:yes stop_codon:yes gene_type:complete
MAGYTNFMDAFRGKHGGFGAQSWARAIQHYSPKQIKVALQQQALHNNASIGWRLRQNYMSKHPGMGNPATGYVNPGNPLGRFQGQWGNLGKKGYDAAVKAGYNIDDIPNLAAQSGMFLPEGAQAQWEMDMAEKYKEEKFETDPNYSATGADVGTNAMGVLAATDPNAGPTGSTQDLKRSQLLINKSLNV